MGPVRTEAERSPSQTLGPLGMTDLPVAAVAKAILVRPDLWSTAVRAGISLAPEGWWRRRPFLPVAADGWIHFRLVTAYGGAGAGTSLDQHDVITWLEWRKAWPG